MAAGGGADRNARSSAGTYALNLVSSSSSAERIYFLPLESETDTFNRMADVVAERDGFEPVVIEGTDDVIRIVTVRRSIVARPDHRATLGDDAANPAMYHNSFQDPERFLTAGGLRGRQLQVLVEGTYYINRLFATVEMVPKTVVEVGNVGVVVSYTGEIGVDLTGDQYKHGELVKRDSRGVWNEPLLPGKYAFNTYAGKVLAVPTTNFILKWNKAETGRAGRARICPGRATSRTR
jgi:uncharacterized membrane protein YqiK